MKAEIAEDLDLETFASAWEAFFRAMRRARARMPEGPSPGDLTISQYLLLEPLAESSPRAVGELAEAAGVSGPTATRLLDGLVRAGLVERRPSERDRRTVEISLTRDGRKAMASTREWVNAGRRRIFEALSPSERAQAERLLRRLTEIVSDVV
jgi:DNA-binding MarR family transcriptional regulator